MKYEEITTFEKACEVKGIPTTLPDYSNMTHLTELDKLKLTTEYELGIIQDAIVGKTLDYSDNSKKWFPIIYLNSESGWCFSRVCYGGSGSDAGSHLDFETEEQAEFFGKTFIDKLAILKK